MIDNGCRGMTWWVKGLGDPADALPMRALSIRQPYAELILRGIKTIEYRSRRTRITGERIYIYAARKPGDPKGFDELGCEGDVVIWWSLSKPAILSHEKYVLMPIVLNFAHPLHVELVRK